MNELRILAVWGGVSAAFLGLDQLEHEPLGNGAPFRKSLQIRPGDEGADGFRRPLDMGEDSFDHRFWYVELAVRELLSDKRVQKRIVGSPQGKCQQGVE